MPWKRCISGWSGGQLVTSAALNMQRSNPGGGSGLQSSAWSLHSSRFSKVEQAMANLSQEKVACFFT
ncbi:hypothetical protein [Chondromyces crocatus]|uniref:hypothetical protein n=1 Tax=Chondromyces crocatus TaxID=52 RepID=UPI0012E14344|nr:hypothetical protein [Chondromyces crocatus]